MKYRREKISSPTVDSTTSDNTVHMFPSGAFVARQPSESSQDGSWLSQGFRPIQESQESGIKTDTQTTIGETVFNGITFTSSHISVFVDFLTWAEGSRGAYRMIGCPSLVRTFDELYLHSLQANLNHFS